MVMPSKAKQMIGKATRPVRFEIEKGQIRRFAVAVGEDNPIHTSEEAAVAAGFKSLVAPPTFAAALDATAPLLTELGLDSRSTMHAEEEYEYSRPIQAGDLITVVHKVTDAYDKAAPNGRLQFVVIETRATDAKSKPIYKGRRVLVELKR
jgi:acyl dehydratase